MDKTDLRSLYLTELTDLIESLGFPSYRARQVYQWIHVKLVDFFDEMTNVPLSLRRLLKEKCEFTPLKVRKLQISSIDGTRKYLFELSDSNLIESVLMKYQYGNTVCISSQVGCRMGCSFCASTIDGLVRNLTASEMLEQVYQIQKDTGERVSHVVVMGSGEPLDNYDELLRFIHLITDENGLHISQRDITVSTCGIVPKIRELADEKLTITLALSLHAPNDEIRKSLMPVSYSWPLEEVLDACHEYFQKTGRRVTFEYNLISKVNDSLKDAEELAALIKDKQGHVNLIPVNPIKERRYVQSGREQIEAFKNTLEKNGINVTIRREMGRDISGACGQLRRGYSDHSKEE